MESDNADIAIAEAYRCGYEAGLAQAEKMKAILAEIVSDYEADIKAKYAGTLNYPYKQREYVTDMEVIRRAKKLLGQTK